MKILFVAAEGAPFSKTGGLGDVIGALPKSLVKHGHQVGVILPYYDMTDAKFGNQVEDLFYFEISVGWRRQYVGVKRLVLNGVSFYFIDNQHYFFRGHVYGDFDDGERFAYFQLAAVELMERIDFIPDVLHVHDYHTAMIPFLVKEKYRWIQAYQNIKTVLTIHNLEFQGQFPDSMLWELFGVGYERYADGTLRWNDCLNWMKAGILYADRVTTVSPSYAGEIRTPEFGCNLDQILRMESGKLVGIVNGIDTEIYLMPSRFEPCGLSQMMAMRYGTLPLVHEVGGLRDTVEPYNVYTGQGTGFSFNNFSGYWLSWTFKEALNLYTHDKEGWKSMQEQAMERDFSWDTASLAYSDLYQSLL